MSRQKTETMMADLFQVAADVLKPEVTVRHFVIGSQFESCQSFVGVTCDVVILQNGKTEIFRIRFLRSSSRTDLFVQIQIYRNSTSVRKY